MKSVACAVGKHVPKIASTICEDERSILFHYPGKQIGLNIYCYGADGRVEIGFSVFQHLSDKDETGTLMETKTVDGIVQQLQAMDQCYST